MAENKFLEIDEQDKKVADLTRHLEELTRQLKGSNNEVPTEWQQFIIQSLQQNDSPRNYIRPHRSAGKSILAKVLNEVYGEPHKVKSEDLTEDLNPLNNRDYTHIPSYSEELLWRQERKRNELKEQERLEAKKRVEARRALKLARGQLAQTLAAVRDKLLLEQQQRRLKNNWGDWS